MFKKTLIIALAALSIAGGTFTTATSAQAGGFGKVIAAGVVGAVIGSALANRHQSHDGGWNGGYRPAYDGGDFRRPRRAGDHYMGASPLHGHAASFGRHASGIGWRAGIRHRNPDREFLAVLDRTLTTPQREECL